MAAAGRRLPHPARPRRAHRARHGALAHHRPVPRAARGGPTRGTRRQRPPRRHRARHADDGLAPARDAAGRGRLRARLPRAQRAARRARLAGRRRIGARRRARGDEPRRRAPPARSCSCSTTTASRTPRRRTSSTASTHLAERAAAYGFPGQVVDGTDVVAVYRAAQAAVERARGGGGPTLLELVTLRMEGHAVHDDAFYVPAELLAAWRERDPIARTRARLLALGGGFDEAADEALRSRGRARGGRGRRARPGQRVAGSGDAHRRRLPLSRLAPRRAREAAVRTTMTTVRLPWL